MSGAAFSYEVTREFSRREAAGLVAYKPGDVLTMDREAKSLTHLKPVEHPAVLAAEPEQKPEGELVVNPEAAARAAPVASARKKAQAAAG